MEPTVLSIYLAIGFFIVFAMTFIGTVSKRHWVMAFLCVVGGTSSVYLGKMIIDRSGPFPSNERIVLQSNAWVCLHTHTKSIFVYRGLGRTAIAEPSTIQICDLYKMKLGDYHD